LETWQVQRTLKDQLQRTPVSSQSSQAIQDLKDERIVSSPPKDKKMQREEKISKFYLPFTSLTYWLPLGCSICRGFPQQLTSGKGEREQGKG
jgi:hypothetical protein